MSGGGAPKPDTYASDKRAEISRQQWEDYKRYYRPIEDQAFSYIQSPEQQMADVQKATDYATTAFDTMQESNQRNLARYGIAPSEEAQKNLAADTGRARAISEIDAKNRAREAVGVRTDKLTEDMVNVGKGVQSGMDKTMSSWMQLENINNQRDAQKAASKNANRNAAIGTAAAVVMTVAVLM